MADDENAFDSSRKRVAGREISKDSPDPDEDCPETELGSFQRASDEVMATRRVVRVKRNESGSASNASVNPFAAIKLVFSSEKTEIESEGRGNEERETGLEENGEEREIVGGERKGVEEHPKINEGERENVGGERKEDEELKKPAKGEASEERENVGGERKEAGELKKTDEGETSEERENAGGERKVAGEERENKNLRGERREPSLFGSFHQLSRTRNAFSGFSKSGTFNSQSLSLTEPNNIPNNPSSSNKITINKTQVNTGEENEKTIFTSDAILYEHLENTWKERGKGEIKLNLTTSGEININPRLVMRARGNYRLILNASVYADMALKEMDKRGVMFACVNSVQGQNGLSTFALKFRDGGLRDDFKMKVEMYKGKKGCEN